MPTDDKNKRPMPTDPTTSHMNPAPNVAPDPLRRSGPLTGERSLGEHYEAGRGPGAPGATSQGTTSQNVSRDRTPRGTGRSNVQDRTQQVQENVRDMAGQVSDTTDQLQEILTEAGDRVRQLANVRPIAVTAGAFALGYVIGGGIPRWIVRFTARVGVPLAAIGAVARYIGGDFHGTNDRDVGRPESGTVYP